VLIVAALYLNTRKRKCCRINFPLRRGPHLNVPVLESGPRTHTLIFNLRDPDFSADYVTAVKSRWRIGTRAALEDGSNVYFDFHGLTIETKTAQGDLTIVPATSLIRRDTLRFFKLTAC